MRKICRKKGEDSLSDDIIYVDSCDFDSRIEHGFNVVFFYSQWCSQSRSMMPIMEEIADEYYDVLRVLAVDVEQSADVANVFAVDTTPTVICFKNGYLLERITEANPKSVYTDLLDTLLYPEE